MSSFVTANFAKGRVCVTPSVFQYNAGMKLRFLGASLPGTYRVDFSNTLHGKSKPMIGDTDGVEIPYEYFIPGQSIYAWIVVSFGEGGTITEYQATIPVSPRAKPTNETPTPTQQSALDQAIAALNEGVERAETAAENAEQAVANVQETVDTALQEAKDSGEFDGVSPTVDIAPITGGHRITITDADGSHIVDVMDGTDGRGIVSVEKTGTAGLVDTYTITYTDGTTATFTVTNGKDGDPGTPGQDGVSPTISVTDITGGHRVTITDATGPYSFDVMDGNDADAPVQDVQVAGVSVLQDGVANVPIGANSTVGVVCGWTSGGTDVLADGRMSIYGASSSIIKSGSSAYQPIVVTHQHESTFYGLAKAAGSDEKNSTLPVGQYTDAAKAAIKNMIGVEEGLKVVRLI